MNRWDQKLINYKILIALLGNTNGYREKIIMNVSFHLNYRIGILSVISNQPSKGNNHNAIITRGNEPKGGVYIKKRWVK